MSVAEKPIVEHVPRNPRQQLTITSATGAVLMLAGLAFVLAGLPQLWGMTWEPFWNGTLGYVKNDFLSGTLLILLELVVIAALGVGAFRVLQTDFVPGARAGAVILAVAIFAALCIGGWLSGVMYASDPTNPAIGWGVAAAVTLALIGGTVYVYLMVPGWSGLLETIEGQGWFHGNSYKGNQGVRVRRGTILGVLAVGACGIITLVTNRFFGGERPADDGSLIPNDWYWTIPYAATVTQTKYIPLIFAIHLVLPLLLSIVLVYFAWRLVNVPVFADFLIATEAEMNKVSWTTRKRLVADTIVVLTTVFLFTGFLFVVDVIWIKVLSMPGIQVLLIDFKQEQQKQQEKAEW